MDKAVFRVRRLMSCLGDPSRFRLVRALLERERCVTELAAAVGLSQSCTTRHLQVLQREGLVRGKRDGKRVMFRLCLDEPRASALLRWATEARVPDAPATPIARRGARGRVASVPRTLPARNGSSASAAGNGSRAARARPAPAAHRSMRVDTDPAGTEPAPTVAIEDVIQAPVDDAPDLVSPSAPTAEERDEAASERPRAPRQDLEDYLL